MWQRLYDAAIMHVDATFGRFVKRAAAWPSWRDTISVLTSDHGEMLGDHRGIVGHTLTLRDDLIRVPLVVRHPDHPGGVRISDIVQTHDLYRTILDWTGTPLDSVPAAQTELPSLDNPLPDRVAIAEQDFTEGNDVLTRLKAINPSLDDRAYPRSQRAGRSATHKYVEYETGPGEFYDLRIDPNEQQSILLTEDPDQLRHLRRLQTALLQWEAEREVFPPVELDIRAGQSDEVEERLRALGYFS
jgi:arylsulfatase A-like enzyme